MLTTTTTLSPSRSRLMDIFGVLARYSLGALFIYMGMHKALHPVEFLKLLRQYDVLHTPLLLNLVASTLPWFETFCGMLLICGIAVRGTAIMLLAMLIPFSAIVLLRAVAIHRSGGMPFCAIKFDCGCGAGEVYICRKLLENVGLLLFAAGLIFWPPDGLAVRHGLAPAKSVTED